MNFKSFLAATVTMASAMGVVSCSNDVDFPAGEGKGQTTVTITIDAQHPSIVDSYSRTQLTESDGDLVCSWRTNDKLIVTDQSGEQVGELTLLPEYDGLNFGKFSGSISALNQGDNNLNFFYLGSNATLSADDKTNLSHHADLSVQPGTLESLSNHDVLMSAAVLNVIDGVGSIADLGLVRQFSFAHFTLEMPEGVAINGETITIAGTGVYNSVDFSLRDTTPTKNEGPISVEGSNGDFYLTLVPGSEVSPVFTVTVDGKTYTGSLNPREVAASQYLRRAAGEGVPVKMTANDQPAGEPENNPLTKWATGNLIRIDGLTNGIADESTPATDLNGALFQWGRNYGYMDTRGIYASLEECDPGDDYTNYLDAMGSIEYLLDQHEVLADYYIYRPNSSDDVVSGVACYLNEGWRMEVTGRLYASADDIKAHPTKYFMDANTQGRTEDYWISSFGNGGSTWAERAAACGYENSDPCPEGWRLPTEAEFREIIPQMNQEVSRQSLDQIFANLVELRLSAAGYKYVIRWQNLSSCINIQAVVVDDSFTSTSQATTLFWDEARANGTLVERQLPYTGFIDNAFGVNYYLLTYYALPYHRCRSVNSGVWMVNLGLDGVTYPTQQYLKILPGDNYGFSFGAYWVSDGKRALKFSNRQSFENSSYILIEDAGPAMGYAVRPVRK